MSNDPDPPWSTRRRVLVGGLIALACLAVMSLIGWGGYALIYRPAVVIPRQREQRRLYERWSHLDYDIQMSEPESVPRRMYLQRDAVVEECQRRFGEHPSAYRDLPSTASGYYD
jgi:hypothetical protein